MYIEHMIVRTKRHVRLAYKPFFFSQRTIFFSHNKSANSTFSLGLPAERTGRVNSFVMVVKAEHQKVTCIRATPTSPLSVDRISSAVVRGLSHEGRLIGREACDQKQDIGSAQRLQQILAALDGKEKK